jgi:hypothetical protein
MTFVALAIISICVVAGVAIAPWSSKRHPCWGDYWNFGVLVVICLIFLIVLILDLK